MTFDQQHTPVRQVKEGRILSALCLRVNMITLIDVMLLLELWEEWNIALFYNTEMVTDKCVVECRLLPIRNLIFIETNNKQK